jgi:hypothetical protein
MMKCERINGNSLHSTQANRKRGRLGDVSIVGMVQLHSPASSPNREFERWPNLGLLVARDSFEL